MKKEYTKEQLTEIYKSWGRTDQQIERIFKTQKEIEELEAEIKADIELMDDTIIKDWYVLGKGCIYNALESTNYDYISKKFKGTKKEFYGFMSYLEESIESFKIIDCGEDIPVVKEKKEVSKNIDKFVEKKKDYSNSFEDSFNRVKKFKYIG